MDFTAIYIDADNGHAFSLENTRNTRSDEPGHDRQGIFGVIGNLGWV